VCHALLSDSTLWKLLLRFDEDLAAGTRSQGCPCGGALHSAPYPRKPRGGPSDLDPEYSSRLSLCCAREGCRKRTTPPSVRFLGRRVYLGAVVVLASALREGITTKRATRLRELLGVSLRTLGRWRTWWRGAFVASSFWKGARGRFLPPVEVSAMPASLLERFSGDDDRSRLIQTLTFVSPMTTTSAVSAMGAQDPQKMHLGPGPCSS
jgi:hypothetical protein